MADDASPRIFTHERFEIRPRDGSPPIRGDVRWLADTQPRTAVVIAHGFKGFRTWGFFPPLARAIAAQGHAAVLFDFSHNGVGRDGVDFSALDLFERSTHSRNVDEIHAVIDALEDGKLLKRAPSAIGLLGHSRGGGEAVIAASEDTRVEALVTWAAIADIPSRWTPEQVAAWERGESVHIANARTGQQMPVGPAYWQDVQANRERLDIAAAAERLEIPWLIVHGENDDAVPADDARTLFDAAGSTTEMVLLEETGHTFGAAHPYEGPTTALQAAAEATLEWFETHLAPAPAGAYMNR
jgi:pimeloyl-ACP methyl ester carboxylesterase